MKPFDFLPLPFFLQGLAMLVDEFYFHYRRELPRWERLGHPLDTLSVVLCYLCVLVLSPTTNHLYIYTGLCIFSCLLITKDEFIHIQKCTGGETWLHSVLFILHPLSFISAGIIWVNPNLLIELHVQFTLIVLFLIYQVLYWGCYRNK